MKELSLNSVTSRRHFYSQILHETGFFRSLTEEGKDSDFDKDKKYKAKWKGRGVIQLTGCANYINFLLYLNINRSGLEQKSIRRYIIGNDQFGNGENSLYCDDSKVSKLLKTPIFKINPYNKIPFNNPDILKVMTSSSADLDKLAQGKIKSIGGLSSEDLNLGGSIHFWKRSILGDPNLKSALENDSVESQVMITKRVNGGLKGLDARLKIFPYTEGCVK